jgi:hypothetical protein
MKLTSVIKTPEGSITIGLAQAGAVYAIYMASVPNLTDVRSADPNNRDVEAQRKRAAWKAASVLGLVFLLTHDLNGFFIGGAALGGIDWMVKHANAVHPSTGTMAGPEAAAVAVDNETSLAMGDYAENAGAAPAVAMDEDTGY